MKGGTYFVMSGKAKNMPKAPGYDALEALAKNKELKVFSKDDDLHIIHLALSRDAWIVTNDTFEDLRDKETGEIIPRERTNYPELDWDLIDEMTWGTCRSGVRAYADDTWKIDGQKFLHPTLKTAPKPIFGDENTEIRKTIIRLGTTLQDIVRLSENGSEQMAWINVEARALIQRQRTMAKMVPLPTIPDEQGLSQRTVSELKVICDFLGIKKSGLKSAIIERILESREVGEESGNEERHNIQIALEPWEIGAIIGPRGEIIQQIRADTGTWMGIDNESGILRISGAQEAIEKARKLVEGLLEDRREEKNKAEIDQKKREAIEKAKIEEKKQEEMKKTKSEPKQTKHFAMLVADELSQTPSKDRPSDRDSLLERIEQMRNELWEAELNSSILNWLSQKKKISILGDSMQTITYDL
tara:strand:- start:1645 stop:2889 length:1245 start_codon:yes stop_codon:yes gene_type:complete